MAIASKDDLLRASDLVEREVELPSIGMSVRVRSLPAAYSNHAVSEAIETVVEQQRGRQIQTARVNKEKLEALQVLHGLIEPKLATIEEVNLFSQQCGPAWMKVVETIDEISGIDKEAIEKANTLFRPSGSDEDGAHLENGVASGQGSGGPDLHVRTGVGAENAGG
jgi:hypothetical protein